MQKKIQGNTCTYKKQVMYSLRFFFLSIWLSRQTTLGKDCLTEFSSLGPKYHFRKRRLHSNQGCWKLFRAGGANRAKEASRAPEANRGQRGQIVQKRHYAWFCYCNFLLILAQSRHKKFGTLLLPWAKGHRGSRLLWHCTLGLIYQFWLRKSQHC